MTTPAEQATVNAVVDGSLNLLGKTLDEITKANHEDNMQASFILRHAKNIFMLAEDTVYLLRGGRSHVAPAAVRVMLESLFKLVAATKSPETAVEILIFELEDDCVRIKKWLDPAIYGSVVTEILKGVQHLRNEHNISSKKNWTTFACAEAAGLEPSYREGYYHLSAHAHATAMGINIQEASQSTGYVLQILIFSSLTATAHILGGFSTQSREAYANECAQLGDEWMRLMDKGIFAKMDGLKT